jgi:hypothetical protein
MWTDTGIDVAAGDTITLDATGTIQMAVVCVQWIDGGGCDGDASPDGVPDCTAPNPSDGVVGAECFELIARFGNGAPVAVGTHASLQATSNDRLYLGINNWGMAGYGTGQWNVSVSVSSWAPTATPTISLTPDSGPTESSVSVHASGFPIPTGNQVFVLYLVTMTGSGPDGGPRYIMQNPVPVSSTQGGVATIDTTFNVPDGATYGDYSVQLQEGIFQDTFVTNKVGEADETFHVIPAGGPDVSLSTSSGPSGVRTTLTAYGTNFCYGSSGTCGGLGFLDIYWQMSDGNWQSAAQNVTINFDGTFSATVAVPDGLLTGPHQLQFRQQNGAIVTKTYNVTFPLFGVGGGHTEELPPQQYLDIEHITQLLTDVSLCALTFTGVAPEDEDTWNNYQALKLFTDAYQTNGDVGKVVDLVVQQVEGFSCFKMISESQPYLDQLRDCFNSASCRQGVMEKLNLADKLGELWQDELRSGALAPFQGMAQFQSASSQYQTWLWGPAPNTGVMYEPYDGATSDTYASSPLSNWRVAQYFDKSRMEINNPDADPNSQWYVTNGLLAEEMITGRMQFGDTDFQQYAPAEVNVAGDLNDPNGPTYATFNELMGYGAIPNGWKITQTVNRHGDVAADSSLANYNVTAKDVGAPTKHTVASVFWDFMTSVSSTNYGNAFYVTGYPLTEPYWTNVLVGGVQKQVLVQVFERRVLTYTPSNPDGWKVEAGNVGLQYYQWRYIDVNLPHEVNGTAFRDDNNNRALDPGEPGLSPVEMRLSGPMNQDVDTNSDGTFDFPNLRDGKYKLDVLIGGKLLSEYQLTLDSLIPGFTLKIPIPPEYANTYNLTPAF